MAYRRSLLALAALGGATHRAAAAGALARPGFFSSGQSQAGQGGTAPARIGPRDTDATARMPQHLLMFRTRADVSGSIIEGVTRLGVDQKRPVNRLVPADYDGFMPYHDRPGYTVNAATPFLFALAARLHARGLIPNGMFGFTTWQGGTPLNAFLPPGDPDYSNPRAADDNGDGRGDAATNYENLVAAIRRYAELTRAEGLVPYVPLIRFEHGEGRIMPRARDGDLEPEIARYVAAHIRMTDRLVADIRGITGQAAAAVFLLGGWGGRDSTTGLENIAPEAVRRLVATRPDRYVGPTSVPYMAPLYTDAGPSSEVHPSFLGRIIIGEAQAQVADRCLDNALRPNPAGFAPLGCVGIAPVAGEPSRFDLTYRRPPGAAGLAFVVDDWLPATPNHGFEYLGHDSAKVGVVAVAILGSDRVRVTLNQPPGDPAGELAYGFLPRDTPWVDGKWNYRGNLVCSTAEPFFYAPILARPPYELEMPPTQRFAAIVQRIALPRG